LGYHYKQAHEKVEEGLHEDEGEKGGKDEEADDASDNEDMIQKTTVTEERTTKKQDAEDMKKTNTTK
jgi:hypothetical protein